MKIKLINTVFLLFVFVFAAVFGVKLFVQNSNILAADTEHSKTIQQREDEIRQEQLRNLTIQNDNHNSNLKTTTSLPSDGSLPEVNFRNFKQMYSYAVKRFNNANYIRTTGNGTVLISGSASGLATISNRTLSLNFNKLKAQRTRYFDFYIRGKVLDSMGDVNINTVHYADGSVYEYFFPTSGMTTLPESTYINKFNWNMTQLFHLPTEAVANTLSEQEISFYFDTISNEYIAEIKIDVNSFKSNFGTILDNIMKAKKPAKFNKIELKIVVDKFGNFKTITYNEDLDVNIVYEDINIKGNIKTNYTESFRIIDNGIFNITKPNFAGMLRQ